MRCKQVQEELSIGWGRKDFAFPGSIKEHLQSCRECSEFLRDLTLLQNALDEPDLSVIPGELDDITFENIIGAEEPVKSVKPSRAWRLGWVLAPIALVAVIAIVISFTHFGITTSNTDVANIASSSRISIADSLADLSYSAIGNTELDLINQIVSNDTLPDLVISSMANGDSYLDYTIEEIAGQGEVDQILNSMSDDELKALYNKIDQLKG